MADPTQETDMCAYSFYHQTKGIRATDSIEHPTLGKIPICRECKEFYETL